MTKVAARSMLIAIVLGIAITAVSSLLMSTFHESSAALGVSSTLTGYDAIKATIAAFGISGYLEGLVGTFVLFFVSIFGGALWQGIWMLRTNGGHIPGIRPAR